MRDAELSPLLDQTREQGHTALNLSGLGLTELPDEVTRLTHLTELNLAGNQLTALPARLEKLTRVSRLNLADNYLAALPAPVTRLTGLRSLNLYGNRLEALPPHVGRLQSLSELNCGRNRLRALPPELAELTGLRCLFLFGNPLDAFPPTVAHLTGLQMLYIYDCGLTSLPPEVGRLSDLMTLELEQNGLAELCPEICRLTGMQILYLGENRLSELPADLARLTELRHLDLSGNRLTRLPDGFTRLTRLEYLDLSNNRLAALPPDFERLIGLTHLAIDGNPLTSLPPQVARQDAPAVRAFLRNLRRGESDRFEARLLILGEGGVGKSSLRRHLTGLGFVEGLEPTRGVDVGRAELPHPERADVALRLNVWDFAGQEIEHATHQFFLAPQAVYLLTWNARHGWRQGRLGYWLDLIRARAPQAPVLLVATHVDLRAPDLPFATWQKTYAQLAGACAVDNRSGRGLDELRHAIARCAAGLPLMGQAWPSTWQAVERDLKELAEHHISFDRFAEICHHHRVTDPAAIETLARTLHALGALLHFPDDQGLRNLVVLKPDWITGAISRVLTDPTTRRSAGYLAHADLPRIWAHYPAELYTAFHALMCRFELCYHVGRSAGRSLVPALLPFDPPDVPDVPADLRMVFRLGSVPGGLVSRFIVRTQRFSRGLHWRDGAVLACDGQWARAELAEEEREFRLTAGGSSPAHLFAILVDTTNQILDCYPGLDVQRLVPCVCGAGDGPGGECGHLFAYDELVRRGQHGLAAVDCGRSLAPVSVPRLLYGLHGLARPEVLARLDGTAPAATAEYRQLILLGQRGLLQEYNRLAPADARCPGLFTIGRGDQGQLLLQLVCQSADGWHLADPAVGHELPDTEATWQTLAPLLEGSLPLLQHLVPLGGDVGLGSPVPEELRQALRRELAWAREHVQALGRGGDPAGRVQEALRQLHRLLGRLDPGRTHAGLRPVVGPDGFRRWLCPAHHAALQPQPLRAGGAGSFDVFLCHNTNDKEAARRIAARLKRRSIRYWLDEERILPGEFWQDAMARGLRESSCTVVLIGEHPLERWQYQELQVALNHAAGPGEYRVIPLLLPPRTCLPGDAPAFLHTRHTVALASSDDRKGFKALVRGIRER
jgi:Leucine-rich repeat (LRR) protein